MRRAAGPELPVMLGWIGPLGFMSAGGSASRPVLALDRGLIAISAVVVIAFAILLVGALVRRRAAATDPRALVAGAGSGRSWITIGVGISGIALIGATVWMLLVLHRVREPAEAGGQAGTMTIDVTAHQFWWAFRYRADESGPAFATANEIHIPTGRPVHFAVTSADVIHSFWVPKLAGKTDTIPGQINRTWLEADEAGLYRGQCGEFCGLEHAGMAFFVIADPPGAFAAWRRHQMEAPAASPGLAAAAALFVEHCGSCHAVRGTDAQGDVAPDLSHIASRRSIASGLLPNDGASMRAWLVDPNSVKPGTPMPNPALSPSELAAILSYVNSLK